MKISSIIFSIISFTFFVISTNAKAQVNKNSDEYKNAYSCGIEAAKNGSTSVNSIVSYCIGNSHDPSRTEIQGFNDAVFNVRNSKSLQPAHLAMASMRRTAAGLITLKKVHKKSLQCDKLPSWCQAEISQFMTKKENPSPKRMLINCFTSSAQINMGSIRLALQNSHYKTAPKQLGK